MSVENDNPPPAPTPAAVEDKKEEVEEWRNLISQQNSEIASLREKLEGMTGANPEVSALRDQLAEMRQDLTEAQGKLTAAETELAALAALKLAQTSPRKEGDGSPTLETPKETSSAPQPQTRAGRLGWIR